MKPPLPLRWLCAPRLAPALLAVALVGASPLAARAQTNTAEASPPKVEGDTNAAAALRTYVQLQEQIHSAQLAIERSRQEAAAAAAKSVEAIAERLQTLEQTLAAQRQRELEQLEGANRLMLIIGGSCAAVGFLAMLLTAYFQWRAVGRLTEYSVLTQAGLTAHRALPAPAGATSPAADQASARLFSTLDRLEQRIHELEHTALAPADNGTLPVSTETATSTADAAPAAAAPPPATDRFALLIAKGQSLLNLEKIEEAIACFDEILALDPKHAETLIKKGEALERLRRPEEAILCYDAAIAADNGLTIAYLHKGGLFNRMERYDEALKCYELALRTQEKPQPA
jgi:tetratricopeptide (TPR) repeat protein